MAAGGRSQVTWTAPDRAATDDGEHRGSVRLVEVGEDRVALAAIASTADFDQLRATVLDSLAPTPCP